MDAVDNCNRTTVESRPVYVDLDHTLIATDTLLENLVAAGLTPFDVLVTATRNPAEFLQRDDLGTIGEGKRADLVLLNGNPLDDIRNTARIDGVMVQGRWLSRDRLTKMLERLRPR